MKKTLLTIVIPCYNYGMFVEDAIRSATEAVPDAEIIVINDGSTDNTREVLDAVSLPNVKIFHKENNGQSVARNFGISIASGRYILCLDADDLLLPEYPAKAVALLEQEAEIGIVYSDVEYFGAKKGIGRSGEFVKERLLLQNNIPCCAVFRKDDWAQTPGFRTETNGLEDWDFWLSILSLGRKAVYLSFAGIRYRKHPQRISVSKTTSRIRRAEIYREIVRGHLPFFHEYTEDFAVAAQKALKYTKRKKLFNFKLFGKKIHLEVE